MPPNGTRYPDTLAAGRRVDDGTVQRKALLDAETTRFIEARRFFILGTASDDGDSDCSYRGRERRLDGAMEPLLQIVNPTTLVFPDFAGNNLLNSIGNLLCNSRLSLLFVDFEYGLGSQIVGRAEVEDADNGAWGHVWPGAKAIVTVRVEQIVTDRRHHLPKLRPAPRQSKEEFHG